jgi:hypothetical protein
MGGLNNGLPRGGNMYQMHQNREIQLMRQALYEAKKKVTAEDWKHLLMVLKCDIKNYMDELKNENPDLPTVR